MPSSRAPLQPHLPVRDMEAAMAFYRDAFGLRVDTTTEDGGAVVHAELADEDGLVVLMLAPEGAHGPHASPPASSGQPAPLTLALHVDDVDAAWQRVGERGGTCDVAPADMPWGERMAHVRDPDGYRWLLIARG